MMNANIPPDGSPAIHARRRLLNNLNVADSIEDNTQIPDNVGQNNSVSPQDVWKHRRKGRRYTLAVYEKDLDEARKQIAAKIDNKTFGVNIDAPIKPSHDKVMIRTDSAASQSSETEPKAPFSEPPSELPKRSENVYARYVQEGDRNLMLIFEPKESKKEVYCKQIGNKNVMVHLNMSSNLCQLLDPINKGIIPLDSEGEVWLEIKRRSQVFAATEGHSSFLSCSDNNDVKCERTTSQTIPKQTCEHSDQTPRDGGKSGRKSPSENSETNSSYIDDRADEHYDVSSIQERGDSLMIKFEKWDQRSVLDMDNLQDSPILGHHKVIEFLTDRGNDFDVTICDWEYEKSSVYSRFSQLQFAERVADQNYEEIQVLQEPDIFGQEGTYMSTFVEQEKESCSNPVYGMTDNTHVTCKIIACDNDACESPLYDTTGNTHVTHENMACHNDACDNPVYNTTDTTSVRYKVIACDNGACDDPVYDTTDNTRVTGKHITSDKNACDNAVHNNNTHITSADYICACVTQDNDAFINPVHDTPDNTCVKVSCKEHTEATPLEGITNYILHTSVSTSEPEPEMQPLPEQSVKCRSKSDSDAEIRTRPRRNQRRKGFVLPNKMPLNGLGTEVEKLLSPILPNGDNFGETSVTEIYVNENVLPLEDLTWQSNHLHQTPGKLRESPVPQTNADTGAPTGSGTYVEENLSKTYFTAVSGQQLSFTCSSKGTPWVSGPYIENDFPQEAKTDKSTKLAALPLTYDDITIQFANVDPTLPLVNIETTLPLANVDPVLPLTYAGLNPPLANVDTTFPLTNVDTTLPLANVNTTLKTPNVDISLSLTNVDTTPPLTNVGLNLPLDHVDTTLPLANVETTLPLAYIETTLESAYVDSCLPLADVDTTPPFANVGVQTIPFCLADVEGQEDQFYSMDTDRHAPPLPLRSISNEKCSEKQATCEQVNDLEKPPYVSRNRRPQMKLDPVTPSKPHKGVLQQNNWYHGNIEQAVAQKRLEGKEHGSFLVRDATGKGSTHVYTIELIDGNMIKKLMIMKTDNQYHFKEFESQRFDSLEQLIEKVLDSGLEVKDTGKDGWKTIHVKAVPSS